MSLKPIKTEADYRQALAEVERLFDAPVNTIEGDRLEVLTTLIEVYEEQIIRLSYHHLMRPFYTIWKVASHLF